MGNTPSGKRRNHDTDEHSQSHRGTTSSGEGSLTPPRKKFIMQHSHEARDDPIAKMLCDASISDVTARLRATQLTELKTRLKSDKGSVNNSPSRLSDNFGSGVRDDSSLRPRSSTTNILDSDLEKARPDTLPTVFKWAGGGKNVCISGTFNGWKSKIPMVKSTENFYTIIDLPEGVHEYKFIVDNQWKIDNHQSTTVNNAGQQNNVIVVRPTDFDVLEALREDMAASKSQLESHSSTGDSYSNYRRRRTASVGAKDQELRQLAFDHGRNCSPPGEYGQDQPLPAQFYEDDKNKNPPLLPPQLMQVILNTATGTHCDPNLLPNPNHVMVNHLYALSIKDGMVVLSTITRYRKKFVSTVIYKPQ